MARSKLKRGYRRISVNQVEYRWRLNPFIPDSHLHISHSEIKGQVLVVRMIGWVDPWLSLGGFQIEDDKMYLYTTANNEPATITGKFARKCILFALEQGWKPETAAENFSVISHNGNLSLPE